MSNTWYAIRTLPGHEKKVQSLVLNRAKQEGLTEDIRAVEVPEEQVVTSRRGKKVVVGKKVFPGYVLINMFLSDDAQKLVKSTSGVTGFLQSGSRPVPLEQKDVERIFNKINESQTAPKSAWAVGMNVRIVEGPFTDMAGSIIGINDTKQRLQASINIFGRDTSVELEYHMVERV